MASDLYRLGSATAQEVDVTSRGGRDLGSVDIAEITGALDITDDEARQLGVIAGIASQVDVNIAEQSLSQLETALDAAMASNADQDDTVQVSTPDPIDVATPLATYLSSPAELQDTTGTQIDPAMDATVEATTSAVEANTAAVSGEDGLAFGRATTTAGSATPLSEGEPVPGDKSVLVQSMQGNAGTIYVGDGTVTTGNGYPLAPGQIVSLAVNDVSTLHAATDNDGDEVAWIVESEGGA